MHPCGREDIDVRMLGNGRPVVIEVLASQVLPNQSLLDEIVRSINSSEGLNTERDIDLVCLTRVRTEPLSDFLTLVQVSKDVWTTMQAAAEEKNKAYMCVVRPVSHPPFPPLISLLASVGVRSP
jgi:tRNA pseudouridine synthase 10